MTETEEKPRKKSPTKKGLHGWKAALAVVGCGTLAAFGVFGVVVLLLGSFLNVLSFDSEGEEGASAPVVEQTIEPRPTFLDDKFDLCGRTVPSIPELSLEFEEEGEGPIDTSIEGGGPADDDLVRSDECWGSLTPETQFFQPWEFRFTYRAIIYAPDGDRDEVSRGDVEDWRSEIEGSGLDVSESGDLSIADEAYYYYGSSEGEGGDFYKVIARKSSGVFMIELSAQDETSVNAFEYEAQKFDSQLSITLENRIPE